MALGVFVVSSIILALLAGGLFIASKASAEADRLKEEQKRKASEAAHRLQQEQNVTTYTRPAGATH